MSSSDCDSGQKQVHSCSYKGCKRIYSKKSKLVYHIRSHTGERAYVCEEAGCTKAYFQATHLKRHVTTSHKEQVVKKIPCPIDGCYFELKSETNLKKHIARRHNPERLLNYNCALCKQGYNKKRKLIQHMFIHTGVPSFKCDKCEASFVLFGSLNRHKRTHTSYFCQCKKEFERWSMLLKHKKTCLSARPKCSICKKTFSRSNNLNAHMLKMHSKEEPERFDCPYKDCKRTYLYESNLNAHIKQYHEQRKTLKKCTVSGCGRSFSKNQNLQLHVKSVHEGIKPSKKTRKARKDKGVLKNSTAASLAGLTQSLAKKIEADTSYTGFKRVVTEMNFQKSKEEEL